MSAQGISGTVKWTLDNEETLFFEPVNGKEGTFADSTGGYFKERYWCGYEWNKFGKYIKEIRSIGNINLAKNSSYMFYNCTALSNLDELKDWNTQNVTRMDHMFQGCTSLVSLNGLKNWDTNSVRHMHYMFYGCSSLTNCEGLKDWNTHNIEHPYFMFYGCSSLATIGVSNANKNILYFLPTNETDTLSFKYHKVGTTDYCDPYEFNSNWDSSFEGIWSREKEQNNVSQDTKKDLEIENINLSLDKKNLIVTVPIGTTVTVQFK